MEDLTNWPIDVFIVELLFNLLLRGVVDVPLRVDAEEIAAHGRECKTIQFDSA